MVAYRAAPQLGAGQFGDLAQNVPESQINTGDGCGPLDAVPMPEMLPEHHLPEVFNAGWILSNNQFRNVGNRAHDASRMPLKRGLTPPPETVLVGNDFDKNPVSHSGMADMSFNADDFHSGSTCGGKAESLCQESGKEKGLRYSADTTRNANSVCLERVGSCG